MAYSSSQSQETPESCPPKKAVSENLVSAKKVSVPENWVLEKSLGFDFGESGLGKKASVSENKGSGFQAAWPQKLFLIFSDILVDIVDQP